MMQRPTPPPGGPGPDPRDVTNVLLFSVLALAVYWAWDAYVLAPRRPAPPPEPAAVVQPAAPAPLPRAQALADGGPRLAFSNGQVTGSIALTGGALDDLELTQFFQTLEGREPVAVLSPRGTAFAREIAWGWRAADGSDAATPGPRATWRVEGNANLAPGAPVTLAWDNGAGLTFRRTLALDDDFMFTVTQEVENATAAPVALHPYARVTQDGMPPDAAPTWLQHEGPLAFTGGALTEESYAALRTGAAWQAQGANGWAGITDKYWLAALVPAQGAPTGLGLRHDPDTGRFQADTIAAALTVAPGARAAYTSHAFAGAKEVLLLDRYARALPAPRLDLSVNFGWFWFLSKPFFYMLHALGNFVGNMGLAIILLTLIIRGATFPLTNISYRSFAHMKKVAPQILDIRKRCGDDKAALQAEILKLYQKEGVNPMAGCLPILIQIPIFFALYKVLYVTIEMRHAPFVGWIHDLSAPDPTSVFNLFGLIPWDPPSMLQIGVLPLIMLAALIVQKHLNPPPTDALQRDLQTYFPFIMVFMLAHFPAGLVLYWAVSSVFSVAQQVVIMRSLGVPIHLFSKSKAEEALEESLGHIGDAPKGKT
jgi:YidC/Oxa1 family membrane protein insertase